MTGHWQLWFFNRVPILSAPPHAGPGPSTSRWTRLPRRLRYVNYNYGSLNFTGRLRRSRRGSTAWSWECEGKAATQPSGTPHGGHGDSPLSHRFAPRRAPRDRSRRKANHQIHFRVPEKALSDFQRRVQIFSFFRIFSYPRV